MSESTLRRAALRLAGLHSADRRWLLRQLPATSRRRLTAMIAELDALGIEDPGVFLMALEKSTSTAIEATSDVLDYTLLDTLPPAWAMAALANEPPAVRHAYVERCPESRRADLANQQLDAAPPRLAASLQRRLSAASQSTKQIADGATP